MGSRYRTTTVLTATLILALMLAVPAHASTQPSIPIQGRYSTLVVRVYIPMAPRWAHDVVLNATIAWNRAQVWGVVNGSGVVYRFVEADAASATSKISFSMPSAYAGIAVGWTIYKYAAGSKTNVVSTQTYLTPMVFNEANAANATARNYGFWLALHELGRILGLGSVLDGKDIMEPRYTPARISQTPNLSTLDLYALHVLAQGSAPTFVTLPDGLADQLTPATTFLP